MNGHIRQRSPGSWELRYRAGGKTITTTVKGGKRDAQRRLRELLTLADQGRHPDDPERLTVAKWLERWLGIIKSELAAQTHVSYETTVRTWIVPMLGPIQLARLTPSHLQVFYTAIAASKLKPSTAAHVCIILNIALSRAVELRLIATNPGEPVKKRRPRPTAAVRSDRPVLDREQCANLLAAAKDSDLYPIILIALATGMRRNEILALRWQSIDFEKAEITVDQSIVHLAGVTSRKAPKNGRGRLVPLPENIMAEMRRLKRKQAEALLRLGMGQEGVTEVCRRGDDGVMPTPTSVTNGFSRLAKRAGLVSATFHDLRHAHASELLRAGVPVHIAAERLGHCDGGMLLLKTYAHVTPDAARDAAKRIGAMFENL